MKFMLSQSFAQVPVKYVSVQCREVVGSTLRYNALHKEISNGLNTRQKVKFLEYRIGKG